MISSVVLAVATPNETFSIITREFIHRCNRRNHPLIISTPFFIEFGKLLQTRGTERGVQVLGEVSEGNIRVENTAIDDIWKLADLYEESGVLSKNSIFDLLHYAAASLLRCDCIASWDTTHFNKHRVMTFNRINAKLGVPELIIGTPAKLMSELYNAQTTILIERAQENTKRAI